LVLAPGEEELMGSPGTEGSDALAALAEHLKKASFRKSFAASPDSALQQVGLKEADLGAAYEALAGLSHKELRALSSVRDALRAANVPDAIILEMV
jgi:hypothetical protein